MRIKIVEPFEGVVIGYCPDATGRPRAIVGLPNGDVEYCYTSEMKIDSGDTRIVRQSSWIGRA